jgi:hypothetical protein
MWNFNFVRFHQFSSFLAFVNINLISFGSISVSFEFNPFLSHNSKVMAKDKKVNIEVTNFQMLHSRVSSCTNPPTLGYIGKSCQEQTLQLITKNVIYGLKSYDIGPLSQSSRM